MNYRLFVSFLRERTKTYDFKSQADAYNAFESAMFTQEKSKSMEYIELWELKYGKPYLMLEQEYFSGPEAA